MTKRRGAREGSIDQRGEGAWRLRYRIAGKRFTVTVRGTKREAQTKLRELLHSGDVGEHVEPSRITLAQWVDSGLCC